MDAMVLVVEDDRELRELLRRYLERAGYVVHSTGAGAEAIRLLGSGGVQLVVLDLGLPDLDGMEVLAAARDAASGREVPVVVLTARSSVEDRVRGLRHGADDYVTKPFSPNELVLRVGAVLHRTNGGDAARSPGMRFGDGRLRIDPARHEAVLAGRPLDLTRWPGHPGGCSPGTSWLTACAGTSSPDTSAPSTRT
jgi:DNA-binding response OmpR family regulator